jgi:hypothetical protein
MENQLREAKMRKIASAVFVAIIFIAAAACQNGPTGPKLASATPAPPASTAEGSVSGPDATFDVSGLMGTWQATKAEGWRVVENGGGFTEVAGSRRDLVAEGGTVTLVIQPNSQTIGNVVPPGTYTVTITMPGAAQGVDTGFWHAGPAWQEQYKGMTQIDFYPTRMLPDPEYGELPAFLFVLSGNTLKLWDSGLSFLPYDFGWRWGETCLSFEFVRR